MTAAAPSTSAPRTWATLGAFAGCSVIWGSTFLFIRIGNEAVPPLWAATLRLAFAAIILFPLVRLTGRRLPRGAALRAAAGFGFFNLGLGFCLLYWGETAVASGLSAVIFATIPLSTALFARAHGIEPLNGVKIAGALVALAGVAVIFSGQLSGKVPPFALAALVLASICASYSGIILKRGPRQSPLGVNAVGALAGLPVCLVGSLLAGESHAFPSTPAALGPILYLTIAGSVGAFVLFAWLVNHWPVTRISFISVLVPVVALVLGALVKQERLTGASGAGCSLVLAGLMLAIWSDRRRASAGAPAGAARSRGISPRP
ncbi:MAG: hypothetical protein A2W00_03130 [Candidatus Eisenbacteria bacterium RBG_16_71_46]|nr:MAG: hypothetical protein A2W00_03130 [Candidatus Eisenbacteria bacterium RBG_16_71_46]